MIAPNLSLPALVLVSRYYRHIHFRPSVNPMASFSQRLLARFHLPDCRRPCSAPRPGLCHEDSDSDSSSEEIITVTKCMVIQ